MDDSQFVAIISPYIKNMVLYLAIALLGQADTEDAVQEALIRAWRAADTLREGKNGTRLAAHHHSTCLPRLAPWTVWYTHTPDRISS